MRKFGSAAFSASSFAIAVSLAAPAAAQSEAALDQAQEQEAAIECPTITDPAERAACEAKLAQDQGEAVAGAPEAGTIVVTGSRITRPNFDTVQPSSVITSEAIDQRGFSTAAEALNELPQFGIPGSSPVGAGQGGAFGTGQSFVNFLGLGSQRTLVLINGRRFVSSNSSNIFGPAAPGVQVDLALVNTKLIERVETIAIGGAPIYGSDAIAGTVNVILKRDYEGIDVDVQSGIAWRGDAPNYRIRGLAGKNFMDGRANVTLAAEYNKGEGYKYKDRSIYQRGLFYAPCDPGSQFNQCLYEDGPRVNATTPGGVPLVGGAVFGLDFGLSPQQMNLFFGDPSLTFGINNGTDNLIFGYDGSLIPADYGVNPGGDDNFSFFASGGNGFAYILDTSQGLSDTERWNANLNTNVELTDNIRAFGEFWYSYSKSTNLQTQPEYNSGVFGLRGTPAGSFILSATNPFLTPAQSAIILDAIANNPLSDANFLGANQNYFYLSRASIDLNNGRATYADRIFRTVAGVEGKFDALAGQWTWGVTGNYGKSSAKGKGFALNTQNLFNAVGQVTADNPNGIPCLAGLPNSPFPTQSSTCAPLNVFGVNQASPEALAYVRSDIVNKSINTQTVFTADMSGPLFKLPGGDFSLAFGVEARREKTRYTPSGFYRGPDPDPTVDGEDDDNPTNDVNDGDPTNDIISYGQGSPVVPINAKYNTKEVFAEVNADIISPSNDITGIYRLDVQGAVRYVDHSVAGGDWTWTIGSRWAPIRDLTLRGNFTHAIRSPSIQEAFIPRSAFFGFAVDPCDRDQLGNGPDPATRAANCAAEGIPTTFQSDADDASFLQATGGNTELTNEVSDAYSVGGVISPRFIPGLSLSVDYIKVSLKDAIAAFSASQVLNACYDSADFASNPFCDLIVRDAQFQPTFIETSFYNASRLRYRGIVAAWTYRANTPFLGAGSKIALSGSYQRLLELTTETTEGSALINNDGTLGYPKNSWTTRLDYENGPVEMFVDLNYTGKVTQGVDEPEDFRERQTLKRFITTNVGFAVNVGERFRFYGTVDNLFDVKPPFPVPAFGGSVTYFTGVVGRYVRFGAGVRF